MILLRRNRHFSIPPPVSPNLQFIMTRQQELKHTLAGECVENRNSASGRGCFDPSSWKIVDSRSLGISSSRIDSSVWCALRALQEKGFGAYLVGGCIRDLLLGRTPKDFDVVTTASLKQVRKQFHRSQIVGRRFPICLVHLKGSCIEVSSFETSNDNDKEREKTNVFQMKCGCDHEDFVRWRDCMRRDFTVNSLFYNPCTNTIYDYANGIKDIKAFKVRTLAPAHLSFKEDCARILRGIRIAARLGLSFSKETKVAILELSSSIRSLPKERLMMEMNFMLAYGAAVPSIYLLKRFKLLEILLPFHALYLEQHDEGKSLRFPVMLMNLFSNMDKLLTSDHPSDCTLWVALLAFHMALLEYPQDALIVWTFSSILYHGDLTKALKFAKANANSHIQFLPKISSFSGIKSDKLLLEEVSNFLSLVKSSISTLTSADALAEAIERCKLPSPSPGLVFVSKSTGSKVTRLFDVLDVEAAPLTRERKFNDINFELLKRGDRNEVRFVLGKIILDVLKNSVQLEKSLNISEKSETRSHKNSEPEMLHLSSQMEEREFTSSGIKQEENKDISEEKERKGNMHIEVSQEENKANSKKREQNQIIIGEERNKNQGIKKERQEQSQMGNRLEPERRKDRTGANQMNTDNELETIAERKMERNKMVKKMKRENICMKPQSEDSSESNLERSHVKDKDRQEKGHVIKGEEKSV